MLRNLIHRLKRMESGFRPGYKPPQIVFECVGPNREVLRTFVLTATGLQEPTAAHKWKGAMKAIARRLRRLEARLEPQDDPEGRRQADSLRDLIRHRCEKTGHPYVAVPGVRGPIAD